MNANGGKEHIFITFFSYFSPTIENKIINENFLNELGDFHFCRFTYKLF